MGREYDFCQGFGEGGGKWDTDLHWSLGFFMIECGDEMMRWIGEELDTDLHWSRRFGMIFMIEWDTDLHWLLGFFMIECGDEMMRLYGENGTLIGADHDG
jgi:hypothetical protein